MSTSLKSTALVSFILIAFSGLSACNNNDDTPESRKLAARQYLQVASANTIVEGGILEFATTIPVDQRTARIKQLRAAIQPAKIDEIAIEALVKTFTTDELKALAAFYGSDVGKSAVNKFGAYSAAIIPGIRKEIQRTATENEK